MFKGVHIQGLAATLFGSVGFACPAFGQIIPDTTSGSVTTSTGSITTITGGTRSENTLFHSFESFNIASGQRAQFDHANDLTTLITRVTGADLSFIDGMLATQGTADFFLINPNGIVFGAEATLNVGGSFFASTAESIVFSDDTEFSAAVPQHASLLTVTTPIGLQYGSTRNGIEVLGEGHGFTIDPSTLEVLPTVPRIGLRVPEGNTLALLGGDVMLDGGSLTASQGNIVLLGAGPDSTVTFGKDQLGWTIQPEDTSSLLDITLLNASSLLTSGRGGGRIQLEGRRIDVLDGSTLLANTLETVASRGVTLKATEAINLVGAELDPITNEAFFPTSLFAEVGLGAVGSGGNVKLLAPSILVADGAQVSTSVFGEGLGGSIAVQGDQVKLSGGTPEFGSSGFFLSVANPLASGAGGDFTLQANQLLIDKGAIIDASTFGLGDSGKITIDASLIELTGQAGPLNPSRILSQVEGQGNGGNIFILGDIFNISEGANLSTIVFGQGAGGTITVLADQVNIKNNSPNQAQFKSGIFSTLEQGSTGSGGDINLMTQQLTITEGGGIDSSTASSQEAGNIVIQAQSVELVGQDDAPTGIFSFVATDSMGSGGKIDLTTEALTVLNGAQIVTGTNGPGHASDLQISANTITLDGRNNSGRSGLFASALEDTGNGGTIIIQTNVLDVQNGATINAGNFPSVNALDISPGQGAAGSMDIIAKTVRLRNQGRITTSTFAGDKGNIRLESDVILLRDNSSITTNASQGATGGNVTILSNFLIAVPTENSDITANALQGQGGRVEITAQAVYGFDFQDSLTPRSDITATSEIGLDGEVVVNRLSVDPSQDLLPLPSDVSDNADQITAGCPANEGSNFIASGRGGLPDDLASQIRSFSVLPSFERQAEDRSADGQEDNTAIGNGSDQALTIGAPPVLEAQGWARSPDGTVVLVAGNEPVPDVQVACLGGEAT
ncbi:MAG: Large exoproteins involved in heme utilization or adhesion [Phormidesmis priestleyi Ana]|uniref:Large exoproteins involved in heme utilization or adhesion n=1 Tax=Phormidesmis priestleyi Ana TaxID=1666911 RepID=A0A0P7YSY2_9CYAN|nr:MAG: Large exoproteins involved in heme utilization or adhesion [Phormidesmis priestleyi Ana]